MRIFAPLALVLFFLYSWHPRPNTILSREFSAIGAITGIHFAEQDFVRQHGHVGTIHEISFPRQPSRGYYFEVTPTLRGYVVKAWPEEFGVTGRRTFYSDESEVTRESWDPRHPADVSSPEVGRSLAPETR